MAPLKNEATVDMVATSRVTTAATRVIKPNQFEGTRPDGAVCVRKAEVHGSCPAAHEMIFGWKG